ARSWPHCGNLAFWTYSNRPLAGHSTMGIDGLTNRLLTDGFAGPIPLLTLEECAEVVAHEKSGLARDGLDWRKGRAASDPFYARLTADKRFIELVRPLLGDDIVLWGVDILRRRPDEVHPWHCDIESCAPEGGFLSVWIGIANTSSNS